MEIVAIDRRSRGTHGSPRVRAELRAKGISVSKKRVERLMRERGVEARRKRRFRRTTDSNHALPIAPNRLNRNFLTNRPNQAWVTDVTYIPTGEGWTFLTLVMVLMFATLTSACKREKSTKGGRGRDANGNIIPHRPECNQAGGQCLMGCAKRKASPACDRCCLDQGHVCDAGGKTDFESCEGSR